MQAFESSSDLIGQPERLQERMAAEGHLFLRRAVDPDLVLDVRARILTALGDLGWLAPGSDPEAAAPGPARREGDDGWWDGYTAIQSLERFHQLAHDGAIVEAVGEVLGEEVLVHPRKIARVTYPGARWPTPPHQDFPLIQGATDTVTAWLPLGDASIKMGGLRLLAGSHAAGLRQAVPMQGVGGVGVQVDDEDPRWRTIDYHAGDVLLFLSTTVHWAPPNNGDRLRLSVDYRYQPASEPIVEGSLLPHYAGSIPGYDVLSRGWSTRRWIEYPAAVRVVPMQDPFNASTPSGSRFGTGGR
ncbi:MAG TPA: phytanoyl-CoA dioxygenase family protein [Candidatus Dormibacteraeota bacterium]|jgi:hypothetical protein|nr:phytanoyl-CoA dioxygenase family protein [Candidatus Dormibacteraeota bacterium]